MPDRLGDFLENSEPSRHRMECPKCGAVFRGNTAIGVRFAMRHHRKVCPFKNGKQEEMTEPPDPRDPDNVGEPEEFDAELARELAEMLESEQFAELADDILLDQAGRGEDDRNLRDDMDMPDEEWELRDHLADIKEQTEDEPVPELVSTEEAMRIIAEAKKKAAEARAQGQGDSDMPISDDAQRVASIGNDETAAGAINEAKSDLENAQTALGQVGEALSAAVQKIQAAAEKVAADGAEAGGLLGGAEGEAIQGQGQTVSEQCNNANQHIGQVDLSAIEASLQQTNLEGVMNQVQGLYQAIKDAASRHQG